MEEETNLLESGLTFLQERFSKLLLAQTILDKVSWRQTENSFQASSGVYTETWETIVGGTQIALKHYQVVEVVGRFLTKGLKISEATIEIRSYPKISQKIVSHVLNPPDNKEALCQLYLEIKEQRNRATRKWRKENISAIPDDDIPDDVFGHADVIIFLATKLDMPGIVE